MELIQLIYFIKDMALTIGNWAKIINTFVGFLND